MTGIREPRLWWALSMATQVVISTGAEMREKSAYLLSRCPL